MAFVVVAGVGLLAFRGAGMALRAQVPLMGLIAISIAALAVGALRGAPVTPREILPPESTPGIWTVFAVFFPAVTGIMAGLGLSGDLRDPIRAIPRGALAATLVGFAVYLLVPLLLVRGATPEALQQDPLIWTRIAPLGVILVLPGLLGAIFSSAVGSILGAPRTLQALAADGLAPRILSRVSPRGGEPRLGLVVSLAIALAAVLLGDLNAVAPVVTMFFLTVYGMINVAAALETLSGDSSWRPRLRVPGLISLAGGVACFIVMFLIHPAFALAAIVFEIGLWSILTRRERRTAWGDVRRGVYEALIRWSLVRLNRRPMNPRNWRPHVLVFVDDVDKRLGLIRFGTWFSQGRGVVTVCELVIGDLLADDQLVNRTERHLQQTLDREGLVAFGEVDVVRDVIEGITDVAQANGMAGLDSNTVLLGLPRSPEKIVEFFHVVRRLERLNKSVIMGRLQADALPREGERRAIDVWWGGLQRNGDLMLLLAHLLTRNPEWRNARIRILSVASNEHMKAGTEAYLSKLIPEIRIVAEATVMVRPPGTTIREIIHRESAAADIVFFGLDVPEEDADLPAYAEKLLELSHPMKTVFFVKNASLFVGRLIQTMDMPAEDAAAPPEV